MKRRRVYVSLFAEGDEVNFYTIRFDGQELTESRKFMNEFANNKEYEKDLDVINSRIWFIGDFGAEDRHFRYAGGKDDNAMELPDGNEYSRLRLYCLRLTTNIVILGNGGIKDCRAYQDDDWLNSCVVDLIAIDEIIKIRLQTGQIRIDKKNLTGDLTFLI